MEKLDYFDIINNLKKYINEKRLYHSISVSITAMNLASVYDEDFENAKYAGLLHDIAKNLNNDELFAMCDKYKINITDEDKSMPQILHSYVGAYLAKELYNINDDIFNSIYTHSLGDVNMTKLQKIIFISDLIEPLRGIDTIDHLKKLAFIDLDKCIHQISYELIEFFKSQNKQIHSKTIKVLEFYEKYI